MMTQQAQNQEKLVVVISKFKDYSNLLRRMGFSESKEHGSYSLTVESGEEAQKIIDQFKEKSPYYGKVEVMTSSEWINSQLPFDQREPEARQFIASYYGNNPFYNSLQQYYDKNGFLTPAQTERLKEGMMKEIIKSVAPAQQPAPAVAVAQPAPKPVLNPKYPAGTVLEIRLKLAKKIAKAMEYGVQHRNLEIIETLEERGQYVRAKVRYSSRFGCRCVKCGAPLDDDISRATGVGPVCAKHYGIPRKSKLETTVILHLIEANLPKKEIEIWIHESMVNGVLEAQKA